MINSCLSSLLCAVLWNRLTVLEVEGSHQLGRNLEDVTSKNPLDRASHASKMFYMKAKQRIQTCDDGRFRPCKGKVLLVPHKAETSSIAGGQMRQVGDRGEGAANTKRWTCIWCSCYSQNLHCRFQNPKRGELQQV